MASGMCLGFCHAPFVLGVGGLSDINMMQHEEGTILHTNRPFYMLGVAINHFPQHVYFESSIMRKSEEVLKCLR